MSRIICIHTKDLKRTIPSGYSQTLGEDGVANVIVFQTSGYLVDEAMPVRVI